MITGLHNVPYFQYRGQFKQQYYITKLMSLRSVTRTLKRTYEPLRHEPGRRTDLGSPVLTWHLS